MKTATERVAEWKDEWLDADEPHWGDKIGWATAEAIAERLDAEAQPDPAWDSYRADLGEAWERHEGAAALCESAIPGFRDAAPSYGAARPGREIPAQTKPGPRQWVPAVNLAHYEANGWVEVPTRSPMEGCVMVELVADAEPLGAPI